MKKDEFLDKKPFSVSQKDKESFYKEEIARMSEFHRRSCPEYDRICRGLGESAPYIPVTLFKDLELRSVPEEKIIRKITSSGTSGQQVSKIFLDGKTSMAQQMALCMITGDFISSKRIPMLIIDSPDVLSDRKKYSARGAGIMGFSMMASKRFYALDENMKPDIKSIEAFLEEAGDGPSFAFGFTYIIWEYFCMPFIDKSMTQNLKNCLLIHGGGWKKLENIKVSDEAFKDGLKKAWGIERVSDYYGMAEQTGSIFMQCEEGRLHASNYSDIKILNPEDFSLCPDGEWGLIALESLLPESYPGHMILTEDRGRILGVDDCPCGRKGKYFEVGGRIKKAEVRGCSDTFESKGTLPADDFNIVAGIYPTEAVGEEVCSDLTMNFIFELSKLLMKDSEYRRVPEIYALGFWCRDAHMKEIETKYKSGKKGVGLVLHIAPSNMPTMFAYSWITSLLAGNCNVVRISSRTSEITELLLNAISKILQKPEYEHLNKRNAFVKFSRGHKALEEICAKADGRIIWGGDKTVDEISEVAVPDRCVDIKFPDKYSVAIMNPEYVKDLTDVELKQQAHLFYNDTYGADQNACSSPRTVFWLNTCGESIEDAKDRWWAALAEEAKNYNLQPWIATEKYRTLCRTYAKRDDLGQVKKFGNRLYVVPCNSLCSDMEMPEAKFGIFYEMDIKDISQMYPYLGEKMQTVVCCGIDESEFLMQVRDGGCIGVDRAVSVGEALNFDTTWDRKDIIELLSE